MSALSEVISLIPKEQLAKELVPKVFADVRFRTAFSDETVLVNAQDIIDIIADKPTPPGSGSKVLSLLQPVLTVNSPMFGKKVLAPYGVPPPTSPEIWKSRITLGVLIAAGAVFAIGFGLGRVTAR